VAFLFGLGFHSFVLLTSTLGDEMHARAKSTRTRARRSQHVSIVGSPFGCIAHGLRIAEHSALWVIDEGGARVSIWRQLTPEPAAFRRRQSQLDWLTQRMAHMAISSQAFVVETTRRNGSDPMMSKLPNTVARCTERRVARSQMTSPTSPR
jgi:hypothetical protein